MRFLYYLGISAGFIILAMSAHADELVEKQITDQLNLFIPGVEITDINTTPLDNLYEVIIGMDVIYMTGDGRFVFKGDLLDLQERRNLSEDQRSSLRMGLLKTLPASEIIEFAPEKYEHIVYVFTDIDCSYCRKLHREVQQHNENGVAIRYLAYPRAGIGSHAFDVMQSVWCSNDPKQALTDAKNGKSIEPRQCKNPVEKHYLLGQQLGIRGTPAIFLENGKEIPGYRSPVELIRLVNK